MLKCFLLLAIRNWVILVCSGETSAGQGGMKILRDCIANEFCWEHSDKLYLCPSPSRTFDVYTVSRLELLTVFVSVNGTETTYH